VLRANVAVICLPIDRRGVDDSPQLLSTVHDPCLTMNHLLICMVNISQLSEVDMRAGFDETSFCSRGEEASTETEDGDTRYVHDLELNSKKDRNGFQLRLDTMGGCSIQDEGLGKGHDKLLGVLRC
jgi:hypothetical protein